MKTIHRFPLQIADNVCVPMPQGAKILSAEVKIMHHRDANPVIDIYAMVDTAQPAVPRAFRIYGTGHPLDEGVFETYVGTVQVAMGSLMFHVFDRGEIGPQQ